MAITAASSSVAGHILEPKAPPTSGMITCTWLASSPSIRAYCPRTPNGPWVDAYTVSCRTNGSQLATVPRVSIGTHA